MLKNRCYAAYIGHRISWKNRFKTYTRTRHLSWRCTFALGRMILGSTVTQNLAEFLMPRASRRRGKFISKITVAGKSASHRASEFGERSYVSMNHSINLHSPRLYNSITENLIKSSDYHLIARSPASEFREYCSKSSSSIQTYRHLPSRSGRKT